MNGVKIAVQMTVVSLLIPLWTETALAGEAQASAGSGIITFQGAIVSPSCEIDQQSDLIRTSCFKQGKTQVYITHPDAQALPAELGQTQVKWLDAQHKMGIMTVNYN